MKYFRIGFSCGCGESTEFITANSLEEAEVEAYNYWAEEISQEEFEEGEY